MNPVDIVLILIIAGAVILALRKVIRRQKDGGCSCGCGACPSSQNGCAGCSGGSSDTSGQAQS